MDPNFFGAPRTGVHSYRLFDIAVVDFGLTLASAYAWTRYTGTPLLQTSVFLLASGVLPIGLSESIRLAMLLCWVFNDERSLSHSKLKKHGPRELIL